MTNSVNHFQLTETVLSVIGLSPPLDPLIRNWIYCVGWL